MNYTDTISFYGNTTPHELLEKFGSPLYVYNESILRHQCREMQAMVTHPNYRVNYTPKANGNLALLQIIESEGIDSETMSPTELTISLRAGFPKNRIFYISNNVSNDEMLFAIEQNVLLSCDSLSQLERYGKLHRGGKVAIRINPGVGAGHHAKVVTGGEDTKFGINIEYIPQVKEILAKYNLTLVGINHHIGSGFTDCTDYIKAAEVTCGVALEFDALEFIDLGGGFYINYHKLSGSERYTYEETGKQLEQLINRFTQKYGREIVFKTEVGRYIVAECGVLLGSVNCVKYNGEKRFIGTDLGMNVLLRPTMYDSHHDIEIYSESPSFLDGDVRNADVSPATIVGNICESGDIIAKDRPMPEINEGDVLGVLDAGAYGFSMCSNYNARLRPAEVLIRENGEAILIRKRDTTEDLTRNFIPLP